MNTPPTSRTCLVLCVYILQIMCWSWFWCAFCWSFSVLSDTQALFTFYFAWFFLKCGIHCLQLHHNMLGWPITFFYLFMSYNTVLGSSASIQHKTVQGWLIWLQIERQLTSHYKGCAKNLGFYSCQAQPKPQLQLRWPELSLISNSSHPPGKVYFWLVAS